MELVRVDTQKAYSLIREKIITLELGPGMPIDEALLAHDLDLGLVPVREAIKLLAHDHLVNITQRGIYVSDINIPGLEQISEIRLLLESFCARKAAERAIPDDLVVLEALCKEGQTISPNESRKLLELDHNFHRAIANAAQNPYLAQSLEQFYGLSQRLWYLALPGLGFLPAAVSEHLDMIEAIVNQDADLSEQLMYEHVQDFYNKVRSVLVEAKD